MFYFCGPSSLKFMRIEILLSLNLKMSFLDEFLQGTDQRLDNDVLTIAENGYDSLVSIHELGLHRLRLEGISLFLIYCILLLLGSRSPLVVLSCMLSLNQIIMIMSDFLVKVRLAKSKILKRSLLYLSGSLKLVP